MTLEKSLELKSLQDNNRMLEYLKNIYRLDGYGDIAFPHCASDSRKQGHVIATFTFSAFKLKACNKSGVLEVKIIRKIPDTLFWKIF